MRVIALAAALHTCGDNKHPPLQWGVGIHTFDAAALGLPAAPPDPRLAAIHDAVRLDLATYEGSGQVTHPDVLVEPDRIVMAATPYPFSNGDFENPSLWTSRDGVFFDPFGHNPIVPMPPIDHNDDPDLRVDPRTGEYELLYLDTERPQTQTIVALRSRDLLSWTRRDAVRYDLAAGDEFIVSPTAIEVAGVTHLFDVRLGDVDVIETMSSTDGVTWDKTTVQPLAIDFGVVQPWHIDVIGASGGFALLISGWDVEFGHQNLYLATSPDLVTWTFRPEPLLAWTDPKLDVETLYRSTGVLAGDRLVVWYAMQHQ